MPNLESALTNLKAPMPLSRRIQRLVANNWTKVRTRSNCCGHPGEPGCLEVASGSGAEPQQE